MSDLSPVDGHAQNLQRALQAVAEIRRYRHNDLPRPHKLVLLLAVLDLYESGLLVDNRIYLNEELDRRFRFYFRLVANPTDRCQIGPPFFHLRSSGFWFHKVRQGREQTYKQMSTPGGGKGNVIRNVEYAYLSDYMHEVLASAESRRVLRCAIVEQLIESSHNPEAHELWGAVYHDQHEPV
jgi:predicted restriction endonuclease